MTAIHQRMVRVAKRRHGMMRTGQKEQADGRAAAPVPPSRLSPFAEQQILDLARLLARIAARDAVRAPDPIQEEE